MSAPAYTYTAKAKPFEGMSLDEGTGLRTYFRPVVIRSDGVEVWSGDAYRVARSAQPQANLQCGRFRRYYAHHGECFHDRQAAARKHATAREAVRAQTVDELRRIVAKAFLAASDGRPEVCPHEPDTPQAIIWTQAYRLAAGRLAEFDNANPAPVKP